MTDGYEEMNELINNAPSNLFFCRNSEQRKKMIDFYNMADIFFSSFLARNLWFSGFRSSR